MINGSAHDLAEDIATAFVRWQDAIADEKCCGASVIRYDAEGSSATAALFESFFFLQIHAAEFGSALHQRDEEVRVVIGVFGWVLDIEERSCKALQSGTRVDARFRQTSQSATRVAVEFHKDQVPNFDVAAAVAWECTICVAEIGSGRAHVVVDFATRAARPGVAHGPEVCFSAEQVDSSCGETGIFVAPIH